MTENEAIKELYTSIDLAKMCVQTPERKKEIEAYNTAIQALKDILPYRTIGTVEEVQGIRAKTIDEFANELKKHKFHSKERYENCVPVCQIDWIASRMKGGVE